MDNQNSKWTYKIQHDYSLGHGTTWHIYIIQYIKDLNCHSQVMTQSLICLHFKWQYNLTFLDAVYTYRYYKNNKLLNLST